MALYVYATEAYSTYKRDPDSNVTTKWYKLNMTNNPSTYDAANASKYEEWTPGMSSFPASDTRVASSYIVDINIFEAEPSVTLPEDCTGMFKGFNFGHPLKGSYLYQSYWTNIVRNNKLTNNVLDVSKFDTSNVKNMTSMFENCIIGHGSNWEYLPNDSYYSQQYDAAYRRNYTYWYTSNEFQIFGIDEWDLSNVENVSRMFANIDITNLWSSTTVLENKSLEFFHGGVTLNFPNVTNAANMFMGSKLNLNKLVLEFPHAQVDFSNMFNGYSPYFTASTVKVEYNSHWGHYWQTSYTIYCGYSKNEIDVSDYIFGDDGNFNSMFRNTTANSIVLGSAFDNSISTATTNTRLNYMFANDSVNSTSLKYLYAQWDSDWSTLTNVVTGYKMFTNLNGLPNYSSDNLNINYANNTKKTGYFYQMPPEAVADNYIKLASGWKASTVYFKTENGWKESEVYM